MASRRKHEGSSAASTRTVVSASPPPKLAAATAVVDLPSVVVGRLLVGSTAIAPLVDFVGNAAGPVRARTTLALDGPGIDRAVVTGQAVLLVFENGDRKLPIVTGLILSGQAATPFQELMVSPRPAATAESGAAAVASARPRVEARLDGERVVLEGKREVVLRCGEASITLRSDGKMVLRGAYIETYSKGLNRIKGASVKIN